MQLTTIFTDDDAVSPVIGVILMVAITVILAAVIGVFVLDLAGSQDSAPAVSLEFENTSNNVELTHQSGPTLSANEITIVNGSYSEAIPSDMSAGDTFYIYGTTTSFVNASDTGAKGVPSGTKLQVVWTSSSSDKSSVLREFTTS